MPPRKPGQRGGPRAEVDFDPTGRTIGHDVESEPDGEAIGRAFGRQGAEARERALAVKRLEQPADAQPALAASAPVQVEIRFKPNRTVAGGNADPGGATPMGGPRLICRGQQYGGGIPQKARGGAADQAARGIKAIESLPEACGHRDAGAPDFAQKPEPVPPRA